MFLEVTTPYAALTAMMNVLNVLCLLAISKAVVVFHHLRPHLDAPPVLAKTAAVVAEKLDINLFLARFRSAKILSYLDNSSLVTQE